MCSRANRPAVNSWEDVARRVRTVSYRRGVYYYQKRLEAQALLPPLGKPLEELALHLYLGKDYTVLMPSITEAVKRLNAQGLRTRLHKKYFISP
jgi:hypothetical protein